MSTPGTRSTATPGPHRRVLVVDDDRRLLVVLERGLGLRGFDVEAVATPGEAVPLLERTWPEIAILDVAMPGMDGVTFCRLIRDRFDLPVLMLTARDAVEDRVAGLNAGADDYLAKPFALDELVARLEALLRRATGGVRRRTLSYAGVALDGVKWTASRDNAPLTLTTVEFKLLEALMLKPERVLTRDELLQAVWGDSVGYDSNVVDVHITNLRRKLEATGRPRIIQAVRRVGYKLEA